MLVLALLTVEARSWSPQPPPPPPPRWHFAHRTITLAPSSSPKLTATTGRYYSHGHVAPTRQSTSRMHSNVDNDASTPPVPEAEAEAEETLLRISLSVNPLRDGATNRNEDDGVLDALQSYVQSFPFAAVLPVQPLTYRPRPGPDGPSGVDVTFLRKKTMEKSGEDGGIAFYISIPSQAEPTDGRVGEEGRVEITAVRNSEGQCVSKAFSEGVIVKALAKGLCQRLDRDRGSSSMGGRDELRERVSLESIYHKWM